MAGGLHIDHGVALVAQTQFASGRCSETKLLLIKGRTEWRRF
jgi:hypothetical protein